MLAADNFWNSRAVHVRLSRSKRPLGYFQRGAPRKRNRDGYCGFVKGRRPWNSFAREQSSKSSLHLAPMTGQHLRKLFSNEAMETCVWNAAWRLHDSFRTFSSLPTYVTLSFHLRSKGACGRQPTEIQIMRRHLSTNVTSGWCVRP